MFPFSFANAQWAETVAPIQSAPMGAMLSDSHSGFQFDCPKGDSAAPAFSTEQSEIPVGTVDSSDIASGSFYDGDGGWLGANASHLENVLQLESGAQMYNQGTTGPTFNAYPATDAYTNAGWEITFPSLPALVRGYPDSASPSPSMTATPTSSVDASPYYLTDDEPNSGDASDGGRGIRSADLRGRDSDRRLASLEFKLEKIKKKRRDSARRARKRKNDFVDKLKHQNLVLSAHAKELRQMVIAMATKLEQRRQAALMSQVELENPSNMAGC